MSDGGVVPVGDEQTDETAGPSELVRWVAGCAIAVALAGGIGLYYGTDVCDQQLTGSGQVVTVCRNLDATDPPMVVIGLVVLVALTAFFTEISGFGVSLKREVRRSAKKADTAFSVARSARQTSELVQEMTFAADREAMQPADAHQEIGQLVSQYNEIRRRERPSDGRTARMTAVVSKMIAALSGIPADVFRPATYLSDATDDGRRIAGYAYVYANPDPPLAAPLVGAIASDRTGLGQYWAIRALRRVISVDPAALDLNSRRQLEAVRSSLGPTTDRAFELNQALAEAQQK